MAMIPEMPATKENHSMQRPSGSTSLRFNSPKVVNGWDVGWVPANVTPEALGKRAACYQVVGDFSGAGTELTSVSIQDVFLLQVVAALDAVLEEKPGKELDLWWSVVLPNKVVGITDVRRGCCEFVNLAGDQTVV